jgi:SIR2-like domain
MACDLLFFIGAGFTKAVAGHAPVGNDFLVRAFQPEWSFAKNERILELKNFLEAAYHPLLEPPLFPRLEDVLSLLDYCIQNKLALSKDWDLDSVVRIRDTCSFLIGAMIQESIEQRKKELKLSRDFVEWLNNSGKDAAIVSTNYDIILDNALLSRARSCTYGIQLRRNIRIQKLPCGKPEDNDTSWAYRDPLGGREEYGQINQGAFPLFKLHGSLNWVYCPRCQEIDITIGYKDASELLDDRAKVPCVNGYCTAFYEPALLGPTMLKEYTTRPFSELWQLCEQEIARTKKLVFVGYSLPEADYLIRAMLIRGLSRNPQRGRLEVMVIDKERKTLEQERLGAELDNRYRSLFGERVRIEPIGFEGLLKDFQGVLRLEQRGWD